MNAKPECDLSSFTITNNHPLNELNKVLTDITNQYQFEAERSIKYFNPTCGLLKM